jgi:ketosteroid isomerase-like protein
MSFTIAPTRQPTSIAILLLFLATTTHTATAAEPKAALEAADTARVAAMRAGDRDQLARLFSDDLRYAHSNGIVDSKASFIDVLATGKTKYLGYDYEERNFTFPAPGIALMTGRVRIRAVTPDASLDNLLSFLAVWRLEEGRWRFLAWQSCRLPPPVPN